MYGMFLLTFHRRNDNSIFDELQSTDIAEVDFGADITGKRVHLDLDFQDGFEINGYFSFNKLKNLQAVCRLNK